MSSGFEPSDREAANEAHADVASIGRTARQPGSTDGTDADTDFRSLAENVPQIVWVRDRDGSLQFMNRRGLEYSGLSFAQLALHQTPSHVVHGDDRESFDRQWRDALESGHPLAMEARLRRHDGVYRWHLMRAHVIRDAHGVAVKWIGTSTDIHDSRETSDRNLFLLELSGELANLRHPQDLVCAAMARLRDRLEAARVTLAEIDGNNSALLLTLAAGDDSRLEVASASLESFRDLVIDSRQGLATVLCDARTDNRSAHAYEDWYRPRGIRAMIALPLLRGGEPVAVLAVTDSRPRDWTASAIELVRRVADIVWPAFERARADRALASSEERLLLAQSIARMGTWEWDFATNQCAFSREGLELFGLNAARSHTLDELLARVDGRDAPALQAALETCRQTGAAEMEYRYRHPKRGVRWIHAKAGHTYNGGRLCVVGIALDVTERRQAEEALKEVNQRKDEFLAMLAHELRNPLAPIRSAVQILRVHGKSNAQLDWARAVIDRQARHLTRLVDDLLDVSRIVRGQIVLERTPLELAEVIQHAVETCRPLMRERQHQLQVTIPPEPVHVNGDLTRLAQVLANLLINAAKYTNEGGVISIEGKREGSQAVVCVRDSGIGISQALLPHIFDLFTQGERTLDRSQGGLGIGLTLVRRIIELHGGDVEAASAGAGQGSEFIIRLPVVELQVPRSVEAKPSAAASIPQLRILVVDDNVDAAESIAVLLSLDGHEVRSVHDSQRAIDLALEFRPDVMLLDIGLPGMDGYEVARQLRSRQEISHMRLIAVTGYGQQEDRDRTREAGFDQHLVKPVEPEALNAVLGTVEAAKH